MKKSHWVKIRQIVDTECMYLRHYMITAKTAVSKRKVKQGKSLEESENRKEKS